MSILLFYTFFLHAVALVLAEECDKNTHSNGIGTVLFTAADEYKQCWSPDEIATLTARMIMEDLLPDISVLTIDNNDYADDIVGYFRLLIEVVKKRTHGRKKRITLLVLTDLLGGYLQYAVLPVARYAFYAGLIDYSSMEKLIQLFEELKWFLRTNGQGWSRPLENPRDFEIQQIDFETETPNVKSCCSQLIFYEYEHRIKQDNKTIIKSDIAFPMPFFDTNVRPSSIAVPFKRYALRNIESRRASYFLLKFFISATRCLGERSSSKEAKLKFQNSYFTWIQKSVMPKLKDDKFYSAFGGILRVQETLRTLGAVPHTETTCPPEGEEELVVPESGSKHRSFISTVLLIVMLVIIIIWFVAGTAYICLRMRKRKETDEPSKKSDFPSTDESKWSVFSKTRSNNKSHSQSKTPPDSKAPSESKTEDSIGICKCSIKSSPYSSSFTSEYEIDEKIKKKRAKSAKDKSVTICYPPFMAPYLESNKPAVIETKTTMKKLPSMEKIKEIPHRSESRSSTHPRTLDDSIFSRTSEERRDNKILKKQYSHDETHIPCKSLPATSSSRRTSWENIKKKIKPGMTIDECWCDILQEEEKEKETEITSEKTKKSNKKPSVEFSLDNILDPDKSIIDKNSADVNNADRNGTERSNADKNSAEKSNADKNSTVRSTSSKQAQKIKDSRKEERPPTPEMIFADEDSPRSPSTHHGSADEVSVKTDKEGTSPHTYACHSSLTGNYAKVKIGNDKPYIYGYDFQSSTSSDLSEDEEPDILTPNSK